MTINRLSGFQLKLIAISAMLIDHVGAVFFPNLYILRGVGRLTMPIMAFLIAEGYHYTKDVKRYIGRTVLFGLVSQIPFLLAFGIPRGNIMFTLALSLLALVTYDSSTRPILKALCIICLFFLTAFSDWPFYCMAFILCFHIFRGRTRRFSVFSVLALLYVAQHSNFFIYPFYYWGPLLIILCAVPLLALYNGERGRDMRWGFYAFYPLHLAAIALINYLTPGS